MRSAATLIAVVSASTLALGIPTSDTSFAQVGTLLTRSFEATHLYRRQDIQSGINALGQLAQAVASGGTKCNSECSPWANALTSCSNNGADATAIGECACSSATLSSMQTCATCYSLSSAYTSFSSLCQSATGGSSGSLSSSGEAESTSAAGSASTNAGASPTSSAAATTSVAEATTTTAAAPATTSNGSAAPAVTTSAQPAPASAANGLKVGSGLGLLGFLIALVA